MKCPACAADMPDDAAFCPSCGLRVDASASDAAAAAPDASTGADRLKSMAAAQRVVADVSEETLWEGGYSPKAMIGAWVGDTLITIITIAAGLFINQHAFWIGLAIALPILWGYHLLQLAYYRFSLGYKLTNHRFFHEHGILKRVIERIEVIDMDDVTCEQGLLDRMMNIGRITIHSSDKTHPRMVLTGIDRAREVSSLMDNARRQERRRRGLHIEAI